MESFLRVLVAFGVMGALGVLLMAWRLHTPSKTPKELKEHALWASDSLKHARERIVRLRPVEKLEGYEDDLFYLGRYLVNAAWNLRQIGGAPNIARLLEQQAQNTLLQPGASVRNKFQIDRSLELATEHLKRHGLIE